MQKKKLKRTGMKFMKHFTRGLLASLATSVVLFAASDSAQAQNYELRMFIQGSGTTVPHPANNPTIVAAGTGRITATPNVGWGFSHWTGSIESTTNPLDLNMPSNLTMTAVFTQAVTVVTYTANATVSGSGNVSVNPATGPYAAGSQVTFTANPAQGAQFTGWSGNIVSTDNPLTVTINSNLNLVANFTSAINTNSFTIFWQNDQGHLGNWRAGLAGFGGARLFDTPAPGGGWYVAANGDTDSDTRWELLWHNPQGELAIWEMSSEGVVHLTNAFIINAPLAPRPWRPIAYHHFNNDSHADILWHNEQTGQLAIWNLSNSVNSATLVTAQLLDLPIPGSDWRVVTVRRVNGDTSPDIVWQQRSTGRLAVWYMNGLTLAENGAVLLDTPAVGTAWEAADLEDLNADGTLDVIWRNTSNSQIGIWLLGSGLSLTNITSENVFLLANGPAPGPSWRVTGVRPR